MAKENSLDVYNKNLRISNARGSYYLLPDVADGLITNYPEYADEIRGEWKMYGKGDNLKYMQSSGKKGFLFDFKHYEYTTGSGSTTEE